ncbi:hypothetical protein IAT40_004735 [Kwoniella sp. CBS 6097]
MSAGLEDLFNSPPRAPPPRSHFRSRSRSRSITPPSPISPARRPLAGASTLNSNVNNPLFFSPGASNFGSPSNLHTNNRNRSRSRSRSRSVSPSVGASHGRHRAGLGPAEPRRPVAGAERSFATHELGTSVQAALDFEDPFAGLNDPAAFGAGAGVGGDDDDDGEGAKKRKRVMAKVDADRLTSDRGFPALCRAAKKFKVKGKGNEAKDLRNLLSMYQMWAHGMFPKGDFAHTVNRVEVVCRTRRMEMAISGYRDAFYPRARTPSPPAEAELIDTALTPQAGPSSVSEPLFTGRPEVDADVEDGGDGEDGLGEDPDLEEMMALEEMEREAAAAAEQVNSAPLKKSAVTSRGENGNEFGQGRHDDDGPPVLDEEDEWEGLYD